MSGWWDSITANAQLLVDELSAQANDATKEIMNEQIKLKNEEAARTTKSLESLPWESDDESKAIISEGLMADILQLALSEHNFTKPPPAKILECCNFDLQLYISQAMQLMSLDQNLAHVHAKISPKMNEETFWEYYFARIYYLKCKSGILGNDAIVQTVASFAEEDVIYKADAVVGLSTAPKSSHVDKTAGSAAQSPSPGSGVGERGNKPSAWDSSSSEDVKSMSGGSDMSTSSYEVVGTSSKRSEPSKLDAEEALFEAQLQAELEDTVGKEGLSDFVEEDDDFDDLDDLDDDDDDDDDELEAQIARELANEE